MMKMPDALSPSSAQGVETTPTSFTLQEGR
jgi:hypothetical protein